MICFSFKVLIQIFSLHCIPPPPLYTSDPFHYPPPPPSNVFTFLSLFPPPSSHVHTLPHFQLPCIHFFFICCALSPLPIIHPTPHPWISLSAGFSGASLSLPLRTMPGPAVLLHTTPHAHKACQVSLCYVHVCMNLQSTLLKMYLSPKICFDIYVKGTHFRSLLHQHSKKKVHRVMK